MTAANQPELNCMRYDGVTPVPEPVVLHWEGSTVSVLSDTGTRSYQAPTLRVSTRSGRGDRFVLLPDGTQLQCPDHPRIDLLERYDAGSELLQILDRFWGAALAMMVLVGAAVYFGHDAFLAATADWIARRVPPQYEHRFGDNALEFLDRQLIFRRSNYKNPERSELHSRFTQLTQGLPLAAFARLELRDAPAMGPNAFALPGAIIVVTDQMLKTCKSPDEALVILAHEAGHIERRHALRTIVQRSAAGALASSFAADISWLGLALSGLPLQLLQAGYSRELESEADEFAFQLAQERGLSVEAFAIVMERLQRQQQGEAPPGAFLSSHPATQERIARARELAVARSAAIPAPQWKVGDRWLYNALEDTENRTPDMDDGEAIEWTVARMESVGGVDRYVLAAGDVERVVRREDLAFVSEVELGLDKKEHPQTAVRHDPPQQWFAWPLGSARQWTTASTRAVKNERRTQRIELSCAAEPATLTHVPAGDFYAARVACTDTRRKTLVSERWYAPAVRQWILERRYAGGVLISTWGLVDYTLH